VFVKAFISIKVLFGALIKPRSQYFRCAGFYKKGLSITLTVSQLK
jgi:hypothetical protein